jgi:predicted amidohydrolase
VAEEAVAYRALALQTECRAVNQLSADGARASIRESIERIGQQVRSSIAFIGPDVRLVVLPEYVLTGFPLGDPVPVWADKAGLAPDGPEYDALAAIAQATRIWLATNAYETDEHFPGLYFQSCCIFGPTGEVVLRYRRLHSMFSPTPYDVWDRYLEQYGLDAVFPVAQTEIGALAAIASEEILYPELARVLALRGAEVFVHSSSEATSPQQLPKAIARRARAIENIACIVSANTAGITGTPIPSASTDGGSQLVDHTGAVLAEAGPGESMVANAEIDVAALRRARRRPGMGNLLARVKTGLWASEYERFDVERRNGLLDVAPERSYFAAAHQAAIDRLNAT